jgi:hypothetical protein
LYRQDRIDSLIGVETPMLDHHDSADTPHLELVTAVLVDFHESLKVDLMPGILGPCQQWGIDRRLLYRQDRIDSLIGVETPMLDHRYPAAP